MRFITCEANGYSITFGLSGFSPFLLAKVDGLYTVENNLKITKNAMSDGGTFQGSTAKVRNIVLTIMDEPNHVWRQDSRDLLYRLFSKDSVGRLTYQENNDRRYIDYRVESIKMSAWKKRTYTVSLLCEDPLFYAEEPVRQDMANWVAAFEFVLVERDGIKVGEHEFEAIITSGGEYVSGGEELGYRSAVRNVEIVNDTNAEGIGLTITIKCMGAVTNPKIVKIETDEHIAVGTDANPLYLRYGDVLTITTADNKKHVRLLRDGTETEINQYISEDTDFIQLTRGVNTIGYEAASGEANMEISLAYTPTYEGA